MAVPADINARRFYRVALQRYEDGELLLRSDRPRASIYLTGYAVECILKALLLESTPGGQRRALLDTLRGGTAHSIEWLRSRLVERVGPLPVTVAMQLALVSSWSTDLRYEPGPGDPEDAQAFLRAAEDILEWAKGRM